MNFDFSPEQDQFREQLRRMLKKADGLGQGRSILEKQSESHSTSIWQGLAELGAQAAAIPEKHAGLGLGPLELCVAAEEIGRVIGVTPRFIPSCSDALLEGQNLGLLIAKKHRNSIIVSRRGRPESRRRSVWSD